MPERWGKWFHRRQTPSELCGEVLTAIYLEGANPTCDLEPGHRLHHSGPVPGKRVIWLSEGGRLQITTEQAH